MEKSENNITQQQADLWDLATRWNAKERGEQRAALTRSDLSSEWDNEDFGEVITWRKEG